jgi:hypothetical protein
MTPIYNFKLLKFEAKACEFGNLVAILTIDPGVRMNESHGTSRQSEPRKSSGRFSQQ